ncbi:metallopeptidase TldD-related protein [Streptomyces sp. NPDC002537]
MAADALREASVSCERAVGGVMSVGGDGVVRSRRTVFHGGRMERDGGLSVFSGDPPGPWSVRLADPAPLEEDDAVRAALGALHARFGAAVFCYTAVSAVRVLDGPRCVTGPAVRERRVWSLTGDVLLPGGRTVPVGRSGRGPGLPRVTDPVWAERTAWLCDAVGRAGPVEAGDGPAVLAPQAAGVLLHEAAGHFAEAAPPGAPPLDHRLGCRIADERISLDDDPLAEGGPGGYGHDDEGVRALGRHRIVQEGRLVRQLHSVPSAAAARAMPTANSRAASVLQPPLPRMSNLVCSPGDAGLDELLQATGRGLMVHRVADGISSGGTVEARLVLGEHIRDGRLTGRYVTGRITERADVLTRVTGVGRHTEFGDNSLCGKAGQLLFDVGTRAPALRLSRLRCAP